MYVESNMKKKYRECHIHIAFAEIQMKRIEIYNTLKKNIQMLIIAVCIKMLMQSFIHISLPVDEDMGTYVHT